MYDYDASIFSLLLAVVLATVCESTPFAWHIGGSAGRIIWNKWRSFGVSGRALNDQERAIRPGPQHDLPETVHGRSRHGKTKSHEDGRCCSSATADNVTKCLVDVSNPGGVNIFEVASALSVSRRDCVSTQVQTVIVHTSSFLSLGGCLSYRS